MVNQKLDPAIFAKYGHGFNLTTENANMRLPRTTEVEEALWDTVMETIARDDMTCSIERILISDNIAGVDITKFCPECNSWSYFREFIRIRRGIGAADGN